MIILAVLYIRNITNKQVTADHHQLYTTCRPEKFGKMDALQFC